MRRILKLAGIVAKVFLFALIALVISGFLFFVSRGRTPSIKSNHSVARLEKIRIGGTEQWFLIRGHDRSKPVLLFLHGGPGMPAMFLAHAFQRELERNFVVVQWDRRGVGKSSAVETAPESLNVRQILDDTTEVTRLLQNRFHQKRIYLVAHSWGTYLGLLATRDHPEYYWAYVGMGQMAGTRSQVREIQRQFVTQGAIRANDSKTVLALRRGVGVEEDMLFRYHGELWKSTSFLPILVTGLRAPEYTFFDALHVKPAANRVNHLMNYNVEPQPLAGEIQTLEVPVFFFLGRHDYNTPSELAAEYLTRLRAPMKSLIWFEQSAHFPFFEEPAKFTTEMMRFQNLTNQFWMSQNYRQRTSR